VEVEGPKVQEVIAMFEKPSTKEVDVHWGKVMAALENELQLGPQGRGWCFPVKRQPLVSPASPDKPWRGGKVAFWERIQLWIQQRKDRPLKPTQLRLFLHQVKHIQQMLEPEELSKAGDLQRDLEAFVIGHSTDMTLVNQVIEKAKQAASEWRTAKQEGYQKWLTGACEGGMRGLYKSIKMPENVQVRPCRQHSGELRPHLRRQEWKQVWKPTSDNSPEEHQLFDQLRKQASEELLEVGPITDTQVAAVLKKMAKKACGPDGLTSQMLRSLEPNQVSLVAEAFRKWEETGIMPEAVTMSLVALIPKKETEERPIALTSYAYRAWCRTRYPLHDKWARQYQVAVTRVIKGEVHRHSRKSGVTLLLDLRGFYENVSHKALIKSAFKHKYPVLLLHGAMQLYRGKRHLCAENMVSAPLVATQGILAGCPLAPGLSKLVMHDVVEPIWRGPPRCHVDLYIDDTGFDVVHDDPKQCAQQAFKVWQEAKRRLKEAQLPLSIGKTAWICSNKKVEKALRNLLLEGDPTIRDIHRDLGIDSGWGKRRRVTTHRARFHKGGGRKKRLDQLAPGKMPKVKAFQQGVLSVALYGHVAVGLSPKRLNWIRHQQAQVMGRMSLGSTEFVLEIGMAKQEDPSFTIINQHFRFLHKLLVKWNQDGFAELEEAWQHWYNRIIRHKEPWRIVVGPFGAAACYLKALGWTATSLTRWKGCGLDFDLLDRASLHGLSYHLKKTCDGWRWKAISQSEDGHTLEKGSYTEACAMGLLRQQYQDESLWLRGLPAAQDKPLGYTQDPRFQVVTWGVVAVAFQIWGAQIQAIQYLVTKVQGSIEVTLDAKGVKQLAERPARWKSEDLLQPVRAEMDRLTLTWINSHLTEQEYTDKFGADSLWRWKANDEVDRLVQNRANEKRDLAWEQSVLIKDEVVIRVNSLLAQRTAAMFQHDRLDGPQIVFPDSKEDNRQQMEAMLDGERPSLGHNWVIGFSKECRQRYQGKDPWVRDVIQKVVPKTGIFQKPVTSPRLEVLVKLVKGAPLKTLVQTRAETKLVKDQWSRSGDEKPPNPGGSASRERSLVEQQPPEETRAAAKPRTEVEEYSYYTGEEDSPEPPAPSKKEQFVATVRAAAKERQQGRAAPSPGDDQEMGEPVKEAPKTAEPKAGPQDEAKAPSSSSGESSSSSSEGQQPEPSKSPGGNQETKSETGSVPSVAKAKAPPPGIPVPGDDQDMEPPAKTSSTEEKEQAEDTSSCYEPVRLQEGPAASVLGQPGVEDQRMPSKNGEEGKGADEEPKWVTMLEGERLEPFLEPSDFLVIQALFTLPMFPNKVRAQGFWKMVRSYDEDFKDLLRFDVDTFDELMHILVQTRVLAITPEGLLGQPMLPDDQVSSCVGAGCRAMEAEDPGGDQGNSQAGVRSGHEKPSNPGGCAPGERTEAEEYSYYTGEEESAEVPEPSKRERFVATVRAAAKERQQGSVAPSPGDDQEMVEPLVENLQPVKEEATLPELKAGPQHKAKSPSSSTGESSSSSSETEGPGQQPEPKKSPGDNQETSAATGGTPSVAKAKAPPPGIPIPGDDQDMEPPGKTSSTEEKEQAASEIKEELKGEASPEGPVETPQAEDTSSCYEPVRLQEGPSALGTLPRTDYAQTMQFVVKMRKDVKPYHSRYEPELRVTYTNCGEEAGVSSTPLQVLGLGGSRITRAARVHQLTEMDAAEEPKWVTMLECERLDPFPEPSDFLVIQALFTLCLIAKVLRVKDVGRYNLGIRELRPSVFGSLRAVVFLGCNGWEPYGPGQRPVFPNKVRAQGFWNMVQSYDKDLKDLLRSVVDEHHADLESLTVALRALARGRFDADTFDELMHILVQTRVLALTLGAASAPRRSTPRPGAWQELAHQAFPAGG
ncbi:unnamed protein product, partial [Symbiodinium sp. CCMP2456]